MELTAGQQTALSNITDLNRLHPAGGGVGIISGYAGTGKTTLISVLQEEFDRALLVCTPTGKAAVRVREASGARASTIHRWLYEVREDEETGQLEWGLKPLEKIERPKCGFLLVDEASMVGFKMFRDLYKYCSELELNLILVGDGFQLPPVETDETLKDFSVFSPDTPANFRVHMTEILRQALDNPIVRASRDIREGRWPEMALGELPTVSPAAVNEIASNVFERGGATICHRNATRHQLNAGIRQFRQLPTEQLRIGEPLMVVQNNYDVEVYNGEIMQINSQPNPVNVFPVGVRDRFRNATTSVNYLQLDIRTPMMGDAGVLVCDREVFGTLGDVGAHMVRKEAIWKEYARDPRDEVIYDGTPRKPSYLHTNLGYALTAHKSQGSEFDEVLVVLEPSLRLNSDDGRKWAYVAVTRAKHHIAICWTR